jgi:Ser/Thr protein kinase RdoA (MazF antagonist)
MEHETRQVLAHYPIGKVAEVAPAGGTAGKCWRVRAGGGRYFLRRRGPRTSAPEALVFDHGLRRHLVACDMPTAAPLPTAAGVTWVSLDGGAYELYPFVEGRAFRGGEAELAETARSLARFHQAAATYPGRGRFSPVPKQFAVAAPEVGGTERVDDPALVAAAFARMTEADPAFAPARDAAAALARECDDEAYQSLPRYLIHGDYHPGNLLYTEDGHIAGIFDLDWACEQTRCRDLADLLYFFAGRRERPLDASRIESLTEAVALDLDRARFLLRTYHDALPLTSEELRAVPPAIRARWLAMRLEGSAKVPLKQRAWFVTRDLEVPLRWLDQHDDELTAALMSS